MVPFSPGGIKQGTTRLNPHRLHVPFQSHPECFRLADAEGEGEFFQQILVGDGQLDVELVFVLDVRPPVEAALAGQVEEAAFDGPPEFGQNEADGPTDVARVVFVARVDCVVEAAMEPDSAEFGNAGVEEIDAGIVVFHAEQRPGALVWFPVFWNYLQGMDSDDQSA